jgi:hypothetical protein
MEGQKFIAKCAEAGKKVLVWTVNKQEEMMEVRLSFPLRVRRHTDVTAAGREVERACYPDGRNLGVVRIEG